MLANEGGWDDDKAIQGCLRLVSQCLAMGGTWCMKHPQTRRMMFLELSFEWAEDMGTSWTTFKKLATPAECDKNDMPENDSDQAAAIQEVQDPAAAGARSGNTLRVTPAQPAHGNGKDAANGKKPGKGNGKGKDKADAGATTTQTSEEKTKAEFNKLWADGTRLRLHHDINRVSCTYIYIYIHT